MLLRSVARSQQRKASVPFDSVADTHAHVNMHTLTRTHSHVNTFISHTEEALMVPSTLDLGVLLHYRS